MSAPDPTWLKLTLRSAALVPATGGTLHTSETLDYLPGGQFLGACAGDWKAAGKLATLLAGQSGVSWSDALPCLDLDGLRQGWPTPASYFLRPTRKRGRWQVVNGVAETAEAIGGLKPARGGYLAEAAKNADAGEAAAWFQVPTVLALKSQHRRKPGVPVGNREEAAAALFTYRAIAPETVFRLRVSTGGEEALAVKPLLHASRVGELRVGRSRAREYGGCPEVVRESDFSPAWLEPVNPPGMWAAFYCVSDVALVDGDSGAPTLLPKDAHFGFAPEAKATFVPERSFIRVRRYSPWNAFHQAWMAERQVIARGSVIIFRLNPDPQRGRPRTLEDYLKPVKERLQHGVGAHRVEGLGWVALNPRLVWEPPFELLETQSQPGQPPAPKTPSDPLTTWIAHLETKKGGRP